MRISLVILFCLCIVVVNSATVKTTPRRVVTTIGRGTTKAPVRKSAYAYLRTVRGKNSCAGGSCPFWERHGRSFVSLRCYAEQYQECVCLHRMCFSSCLFTRQVCNNEMVSCLKQICPRCMPAAETAMCSVYDSMATQVANALSVFACYACCPNTGNSTTTPTNIIITTTRGLNNQPPTGTISGPGGLPSTTTISQNGGSRPPNGGNGGNGVNGGNGGNGVNGGSNQGGTGNQGGGNTIGGVFPGSGNVNVNANNAPSQNQRAKQTASPTTRRVVTTRRTSATTRRAATVKAQKKPQTNKQSY